MTIFTTRGLVSRSTVRTYCVFSSFPKNRISLVLRIMLPKAKVGAKLPTMSSGTIISFIMAYFGGLYCLLLILSNLEGSRYTSRARSVRWYPNASSRYCGVIARPRGRALTSMRTGPFLSILISLWHMPHLICTASSTL